MTLNGKRMTINKMHPIPKTLLCPKVPRWFPVEKIIDESRPGCLSDESRPGCLSDEYQVFVSFYVACFYIITFHIFLHFFFRYEFILFSYPTSEKHITPTKETFMFGLTVK